MPRKTNERIVKDYLVLCEGRDAQEFLIKYFNSSELKKVPEFENNIQVIDFGGISDLTKFLESLRKLDGFPSVKNLAIIRDAEQNAKTAVDNIKSALHKNNFVVPDEPNQWEIGTPNIGYILFPKFDMTATGALEDLCLTIIAEDGWEKLKTDIQAFVLEMEKKRGEPLPRKFKNELHTYFSATDSFVSMKIGEAASAGAFNWEHDALTPLREFLAMRF